MQAVNTVHPRPEATLVVSPDHEATLREARPRNANGGSIYLVSDVDAGIERATYGNFSSIVLDSRLGLDQTRTILDAIRAVSSTKRVLIDEGKFRDLTARQDPILDMIRACGAEFITPTEQFSASEINGFSLPAPWGGPQGDLFQD